VVERIKEVAQKNIEESKYEKEEVINSFKYEAYRLDFDK
jgi:hypothetical protein